jgi:carboxymethylenebutenolidase
MRMPMRTKARPWPGVIVLHGRCGLDPTTRGIADHLAAAGYLVLAPNLFGSDVGGRRRAGAARAASSGRGRTVEDIEAARRWLTAEPTCTGRIGVLGWRLGGGLALRSAGRGFEVAAVNDGPLPRDLAVVLRDACPVVASYDGRHRRLRAAARRLESALTLAGVPHDVKAYPTAGRAFSRSLPDGPTGRPRALPPVLRAVGIGTEPHAAADTWVRIERFFAEYLRP